LNRRYLLESKFIDINGVSLNYGEGQLNGPTLVFLHGFPGAWTEHGPVYELLEPYYHVIAPTHRGLGQSQWSDSYSIPQWIDDVGDFIHAVVETPVLGVGHSAGSWFGLAAANTDPGLFSAFVSLDQPLNPEVHIAYHTPRIPTVRAAAMAMREATDVDDLARRLAQVPISSGGTYGDLYSEAELAEYASELSTSDPAIFNAWVNNDLASLIDVPEVKAWPGAYRNPLLFLDGDPGAGSLVSVESAAYNMERYPWARRIEMPGLDHGLGLWDDPGPVVKEIRSFFHGLQSFK
jgi:pimeloyl-ACP methyl ester carboxylesterase